jgi:hypothetical protein
MRLDELPDVDRLLAREIGLWTMISLNAFA